MAPRRWRPLMFSPWELALTSAGDAAGCPTCNGLHPPGEQEPAGCGASTTSSRLGGVAASPDYSSCFLASEWSDEQLGRAACSVEEQLEGRNRKAVRGHGEARPTRAQQARGALGVDPCSAPLRSAQTSSVAGRGTRERRTARVAP